MKVLAIANQKGGVGKSTTAAALSAGLSAKGYRVLVIDLDPQGNLSYNYDVAGNGKPTALGVITGEVSTREAIQKTGCGDIIASSRQLSGADLFLDKTGKEYKLREALEGIAGDYDFIVIDTPPSLGILTINALTCADGVIIPSQADIYSIQGIQQLMDTIATVKKYCNSSLKVEGILLTRYSGRSVLSRELLESIQDYAADIGSKVFNATIREGIAVKEAQISQVHLLEYAPNSNVTNDYRDFVNEILEGMSDK